MILKNTILSMLLATFLIGLACSKNNPIKEEEQKCNIPDQLCDSAQLVIGNKTNDTVFFNKGESGTNVEYYLSVNPGETTTLNTSGTDVRFNADCSVYYFSGPSQGLQIQTRYFTVKMNRCIKRVYFVSDGNNNIDLEIEDKD